MASSSKKMKHLNFNQLETTAKIWDEVDSDETKNDLTRWFEEYKIMQEENKLVEKEQDKEKN